VNDELTQLRDENQRLREAADTAAQFLYEHRGRLLLHSEMEPVYNQLNAALAGDDGNATFPECTLPTWLDDHESCCKDAYQRGWDAAVEEIGDCNDR
jgi:hypothetical protein